MQIRSFSCVFEVVLLAGCFAAALPGQVAQQNNRTRAGYPAGHELRTAAMAAGGLTFVPVTPCRLADSRLGTGPFGGPILGANTARDFIVPEGACNIPMTAAAYSLNVTVVPNGILGYLAIWPSGQAQPVVSTLNSDGRVKANAAIVPAGANGGVTIYVSQATHVILDINGYFVPEAQAAGLEFYPLLPCRVADTRVANGVLGGPFLAGGVVRTLPVRSSGCGVSASAQAYSLNFTAVPHGPIGFLAAWPSGQAQPEVSTLNTSSNAVTANAAVVPAGVNGSVDVYSSNDTDLVVDINGYFAPAGTGGLELYAATPCRLLDTRVGSGGMLNGSMAVAVTGGACGTPANAQALVLNATVAPPGELGYLSVWPDGVAKPLVSTLNSSDGAVTSNMAVVPMNDGEVDIYSSNPTHAILDIASYFAPSSTQPSAGMTITPAAIAAGASATLTWSSSNTASCLASGAWSGVEATSGSQTLIGLPVGTYQYNLTCTGVSGTVNASAKLTVNAAVTPFAVRVQGNRLVDANGNTLQLRGVDVSGLEETAVQGWATLPNGGYNVWGDAGLGTEPPWQTIHDNWHSNVVRLPLNEASWLGYTCTNADGTTENPDPGGNYQAIVEKAVADANAAGLYVILDLHWSAPRAMVNGALVDVCPVTQNPMVDADHGTAFWSSLAATFKGNQSVIFELFNEPFLYWLAGGEDQWAVLENGGTITQYRSNDTTDVTYSWTALGMQQLLNAVRVTGAANVVLVSGVAWNADLSSLESHMPLDPANQLAVAWHPYPSSSAPTQPSAGVAQYTYATQLAANYPFIITETGDHDAPGTVGSPFVSIVLPWADSNGMSYLGWTWDPWGEPDDVLIKDAAGTPTDGYGQYFLAHLTCRAAGQSSCP